MADSGCGGMKIDGQNVFQVALEIPLDCRFGENIGRKRARDADRSDEQLATLRDGLVRAQSSILYGVSTGPNVTDMEPFHGTASRFLQEVCVGVKYCARC